MMGRTTPRAGFTLIELMVVTGTIALLVAILLPSLARARSQAQTTQCLSNLRQFVIASHTYAYSSDDHFPLACDQDPYPWSSSVTQIVYNYWDFKTTVDRATLQVLKVEPGLLWVRKTNVEVQQCPTFHGPANSYKDPYTGYNYNTSYVGHAVGESSTVPLAKKRLDPSAKVTDVRRPAECALFGDGEYAGGANKYMRPPWECDGDMGIGSARGAGTQGYRHLGKTNVGFVDGHAVAWGLCYTETYSYLIPQIAPGTGFLSPDNHLYNLK